MLTFVCQMHPLLVHQSICSPTTVGCYQASFFTKINLLRLWQVLYLVDTLVFLLICCIQISHTSQGYISFSEPDRVPVDCLNCSKADVIRMQSCKTVQNEYVGHNRSIAEVFSACALLLRAGSAIQFLLDTGPCALNMPDLGTSANISGNSIPSWVSI